MFTRMEIHPKTTSPPNTTAVAELGKRMIHVSRAGASTTAWHPAWICLSCPNLPKKSKNLNHPSESSEDLQETHAHTHTTQKEKLFVFVPECSPSLFSWHTFSWLRPRSQSSHVICICLAMIFLSSKPCSCATIASSSPWRISVERIAPFQKVPDELREGSKDVSKNGNGTGTLTNVKEPSKAFSQLALRILRPCIGVGTLQTLSLRARILNSKGLMIRMIPFSACGVLSSL